jgi:hypothetical protein
MSRFSDYLQTTFDFSAPEAEEIIVAMKKPIGKSIRVNTRKFLSKTSSFMQKNRAGIDPDGYPRSFSHRS